MEINEIKKQLDENTKKIVDNMNKIHQNSGALEILKDFKDDNKRMFIILLIVLFMWFFTIGYLVYVLNDIGTIEVSQENDNGYNNYIGEDGDITYGETNN